MVAKMRDIGDETMCHLRQIQLFQPFSKCFEKPCFQWHHTFCSQQNYNRYHTLKVGRKVTMIKYKTLSLDIVFFFCFSPHFIISPLFHSSWGSRWGEQGYIRMARNKNLCAIARRPIYPIVGN